MRTQNNGIRLRQIGKRQAISAYNEPMLADSPALRIVHTVCSHDCPDSCAVLVSVDETGRAVKVAGDPAHPVTNGFLCGGCRQSQGQSNIPFRS